MTGLSATIYGKPAQQGSKKHVGGGVMIESNEKDLRAWRTDAIAALREAAGPDWEPLSGQVYCVARFIYARPKSHYGTGRNADKLKESAPAFKTSAPDLDKLQRALGDALTQAGIIRDDSLIAYWAAMKVYGEVSRTEVNISQATIN